jgi:hypothetical protein
VTLQSGLVTNLKKSKQPEKQQLETEWFLQAEEPVEEN